MIKMPLKQSIYGKVRVIEGFKGNQGPRLFVKKTNINSYIVLDHELGGLDDMVSIEGQYHFRTLKELKEALIREDELHYMDYKL